MKTIHDTFTASEAAHLTEMNKDVLRVWRGRDYFSLDGEREGWTRYTFRDVLKIATFRTMVDGKQDHSLARLAVDEIDRYYSSLVEGDVLDGPLTLIAASEKKDGVPVTSFQVIFKDDVPQKPWGASDSSVTVTIQFQPIIDRLMARLRELNERA